MDAAPAPAPVAVPAPAAAPALAPVPRVYTLFAVSHAHHVAELLA